MTVSRGTALAQPVPKEPLPGPQPRWPAQATFRLLLWVVALVTTVVVLSRIGHGTLAAPPLTTPATLPNWLAERGAATAFVSLVRLAVLTVAGYLLVVTVLGTILRLLQVVRLVAVVDAVSLPAVRRLVQGAVGLSLGATAMTSTLLSARPVGASGQGDDIVVMELLPGGPGSSTAVLAPDARGASERPPPPTPADVPAPQEWRAGPGGHFWAAAEQTLSEAWSRPPSDAEVEPYWRQLVELNRSRLVDPDNPDLVFPGQRFELPPPPPAPRGSAG